MERIWICVMGDFKTLYASGLSITQVSDATGIAKSTLRFRLKRLGMLRSTTEGIRLRLGDKDYVNPNKGATRFFTKEWKRNISKGKTGTGKGTRINSQGYIEITAGKNKGRNQHTVIMEKHIGRRIKKTECVHHINSIKTDNRIENLKLMHVSDHARLHAFERINNNLNYDISQHSKKGEDHPIAKLTERDVLEILRDRRSTEYYCDKFGLKKSAINKIKRRESWKHLKV